MELTIELKGNTVTAFRPIGQPVIREGEEVEVLLQKIYLVTDQGQDGREHVQVVINEAVNHVDSLVI